MPDETLRSLLYRRDVAVARHRTTLARRLGVTDVEMQALVHLSQREELSPSAIGTLLDLSSGGATVLVQRLERAGHVSRRQDPGDRRRTLIALSPRTRDLLERAESRITGRLDSLSESERAIVIGVLEELVTLSEAPVPRRKHVTPVPALWA